MPNALTKVTGNVIDSTTNITIGIGSTSGPSLSPNGDSNTGIFFPSADTIAFGEGGVEAARFDSSGRLLVGTSTASANGTLFLQGTNAGSTLGGTIRMAAGTTSPANGAELGIIAFSDSSHSQAAFMLAKRDGGTWTSGSSMPTRLEFSTTADGASSPTERMRITNAGKILVNNGADTDAQAVIRTTSSLGGYNLYLDAINTYSTTYRFMRFRVTSSTSVVGEIVSNDGASTVYSTTSDYRLKENIAIIDDGITRFKQLKPCRFNFLVNPSQTVDGFIAHEVQEVVPEAITGNKDAVDDDGNPIYQGIDQSKLVPLLTAALQEAIGEIESLNARVAALESA